MRKLPGSSVARTRCKLLQLATVCFQQSQMPVRVPVSARLGNVAQSEGSKKMVGFILVPFSQPEQGPSKQHTHTHTRFRVFLSPDREAALAPRSARLRSLSQAPGITSPLMTLFLYTCQRLPEAHWSNVESRTQPVADTKFREMLCPPTTFKAGSPIKLHSRISSRYHVRTGAPSSDQDNLGHRFLHGIVLV